MKDRISTIYNKYREIIVYIFWGAMATVVSWGSYTVFAYLLAGSTVELNFFSMKVSVTVFVANILSWILAVSFAFFTNKVFVFQSKSWKMEVWVAECVKFVGARIATGVLEIVGVPFMVAIGLNQTIFDIEGIVSKIIVSIAVVVLNYVLSKILVFREECK